MAEKAASGGQGALKMEGGKRHVGRQSQRRCSIKVSALGALGN